MFTPPQNLSQIHDLICRIASGIAHLHKNDIVHGDLHANNIMFDGDQAKVAEYGLFAARGQKRSLEAQTPKHISGCPKYWSSDKPSKEDDVWAFGDLIMDIVLT
jgi:serine/threonine protein kinase